MRNTFSILTHSTNSVTKTWKADGSIAPFDDAKFYKLNQHPVFNIAELSALLTKIEADRHTCLIRGAYVGDVVAHARDAEQFKRGMVRKAFDYFDDQPLNTVMLDVDSFEPLCWNPLTHPQESIAEFIQTRLPIEWHAASYHWQLSSSFGHPTKVEDGLKVHLWFWLDQSLTSAQMRAFSKSTELSVDHALFNPVQAHFTASPVFEQGVTDPYPIRSGFVKRHKDTVKLHITDDVRDATLANSSTGQRLLEIAGSDPVASKLAELGLVKSKTRDGFNIECPFDDEHSGPSAESSTQYRLPFTNGHALGQFICLHAHCAERRRTEFMQRIGLDNPLDDFDDVSQVPEVIAAATKAEEVKEKKAARFKLQTASEFVVRRKSSWLIKGVVPQANMGVIYGASGSGKSFFVLNLIGAISQGKAWRDHHTSKASVCWIAAEGQEDMRKRVFAYCQDEGIAPDDFPMQFVDEAPNFMEELDIKTLIAQIKKVDEHFDVVVVDTLAQVMAGGNENSSEDMGRVLAYCKQITRETGAMVILIHHSGKDESRGARGWSGLRAAADFEFEIIRSEDDRMATITKMKGGTDGTEFGFRLDTICVGADEDGDEENTCVVRFNDSTKEAMLASKEPKDALQKRVERAVDVCLDMSSSITTNEIHALIDAQVAKDQFTNRDKRKQYTNTYLRSLTERSIVQTSDAGLVTRL